MISRTTALAVWTPRIGREGAIRYWHAYASLTKGLLIGIIGILTLRFGDATGTVGGFVAGALLLLTAAGLIAWGSAQRRRFFALASEAFGVPVRRGNVPPTNEAGYRRWLVENRLEVNPADCYAG